MSGIVPSSNSTSKSPTARGAAGASRGDGRASAKARSAAFEYTIDELAREAGTTVRNVRAYQDRQLLPPPEKRGRTGIYSKAHLGRLKLIGQLLSRGYTLANIGELLEAVERGHDLRQILGLEAAITSPWSEEIPAYFSLPDLLRMFKVPLNPKTLAKVIKLGILEPDGLRYRAPYPKILKAGAELTRIGLSLDDMLAIIELLRENVQRVADEVIKRIVGILDQYGEGKLPPPEDVPRLADMIWQLRPLANMAIDAEVSRAMDKSIGEFFGDRVVQILEHIREKAAE